MVKRSKGLRSSTRKKFTRYIRDRGKTPVSRTVQVFEAGQNANIVIDPSVQKGQPHHRFHGLTGVVTGTQGNAYVVKVRVGNMEKALIIRPEHLRTVRN